MRANGKASLPNKPSSSAPQLRSLDALPLTFDNQLIEQTMLPFCVPDSSERRWRSLLDRRLRKTLKRTLGRLSGGLLSTSRRDIAAIHREYTEAWSAGYERYRLDRDDLNPAPWLWRERRLLLDPAAATRIRAVLFGAVLNELQPQSVLEVGSGNGINLFAVAGAFPKMRFTGVELTSEGVEQARSAQADAATLHTLTHYSPLPMRDPDALRRIEFVQGNASALPFSAGSFDLVLTVLAIEQMDRIRDRALAEISRVTGSHALMLEPFREVNASFLRRLYVFSRDYFRGAIGDLPGHGLEPVWATDDFPQEAFLGAALVLSRKKTSALA